MIERRTAVKKKLDVHTIEALEERKQKALFIKQVYPVTKNAGQSGKESAPGVEPTQVIFKLIQELTKDSLPE